MISHVAASLLLEGLAPPEELNVCEWADRCRVLPSEGSAAPGQWVTDRTPYLREIMEALSPDSGVERVTVAKAAQVGATEIALNLIGHAIDQAPCPILFVQPTENMVNRFSMQRLGPTIEATPSLRASVAAAVKADRSGGGLQTKRFTGGILVLTWANSASGLSSMPAQLVILDEVDRYPEELPNEGDPVELAIARAESFEGRRKILEVSTPTDERSSRIWRSYEESDQRVFRVPCPACGTFQALEWVRLTWDKGDPSSARYICASCEHAIDHSRKAWMLARGEWQATAQASTPGHRGYHIHGLLSPWVHWSKLAARWVAAGRDPVRLRTVMNLGRGEVWRSAVEERIDAEGLRLRGESWGDTVPREVAFITAGVDQQQDRFELEVVGWGRDLESWSLDYRVIWTDPTQASSWRLLEAALLRTYKRAGGGELPIMAAAIDSSWNTTLTYQHVRPWIRRRWFPVKGHMTPGHPVWANVPTKNTKGGCPLWMLGVHEAKGHVRERLKIPTPGPGYCHLPAGRAADWFEQLVAERLVVKRGHWQRSERWELIHDHARNEALDCRVYAYAVAVGLLRFGLNVDAELERLNAVAERRAAPTRSQRSGSTWSGAGPGWMDGYTER